MSNTMMQLACLDCNGVRSNEVKIHSPDEIDLVKANWKFLPKVLECVETIGRIHEINGRIELTVWIDDDKWVQVDPVSVYDPKYFWDTTPDIWDCYWVNQWMLTCFEYGRKVLSHQKEMLE